MLNVDYPLGEKWNKILQCFSAKAYMYTTGYWSDICVYPVDWGGPGEYMLYICVYPID